MVNEKTNLSSTYIGKSLNRDHATILHYYKEHNHNIKYYEEYKSMFETCLGIYNCDPEIEILKNTSVSQIIIENSKLKTELALKNSQIEQLSNNY